MALFSVCYNWMLPHEAGTPPSYEITPDNKGQVIAGVNSLAWQADFAAIAALPIKQRPVAVQSFYERRFWSPFCSQIASDNIAAYLLDSRVNQGPGTGAGILQEAVNACGMGLAVDGALGPNTVAAVNSVPWLALLHAFQDAREAAYRKIGGPNLPAWLARAALLPNLDM